jgi:uncharacterized protein (UPF0210 family)
MKIRAITLGYPLGSGIGSLPELIRALEKIEQIKRDLGQKGIEVQTVRLCTLPFDHHSDVLYISPEEVANHLDTLVQKNLVNYYSFLPGLCDHSDELTQTQVKYIESLPRLLKNHTAMFASLQVASSAGGINLAAITHAARLIKDLSTPDPFTNLKFAVKCNVPPNTPFFPSAYHAGPIPRISIALEAADEIVQILRNHPLQKTPISTIQSFIKDRFTEIYDRIADFFKPTCEEMGWEFHGIDFSPAQYPTPEKSIGTAIEALGLGHFGDQGTLFGVGLLTSAIQSVPRPKIGFSGFMQPLLEDATIALRNAEGNVDINKLMLYSTVCGLGLDCIPLPGNASDQQLALIIMDLAMLSVRLHKPLTARLMPIPGKSAGEMTAFNFEYFMNSPVCNIAEDRSIDLKKILAHTKGFLL